MESFYTQKKIKTKIMKKIFYIITCLYILIWGSLKADPIDSLQKIQIQKELTKKLEAQMKQNEANDKAGKSHLNNYIIRLNATFKGQELSPTFVDEGEKIWNLRELEVKDAITSFNTALNKDNIKYYLVVASIYKYTDDIDETYSGDKIKDGIGKTSWKNNQVGYFQYKENGKLSANKPTKNKAVLKDFTLRLKPPNTASKAIIDYKVSFYMPHNGQNLIYHYGFISFPVMPENYEEYIYSQANASYQTLNDNLLADKTNWLKERIGKFKTAYLAAEEALNQIKNALKNTFNTNEQSECFKRAVRTGANTPSESTQEKIRDAALEYGICMTEEHNLSENDSYGKKYTYGIINELFYTIKISIGATNQDIENFVHDMLVKIGPCIEQITPDDFSAEQLKRVLRCMGIQGIDQYQAFVEASFNYAKREYTNPYLQGKVNFFMLSTFLPIVGELKIAEGKRNLDHLSNIRGVTNLVVFAEKFAKLKDATRAARVLNTKIALHKQKRIWQVVAGNPTKLEENILEEVLETIGKETQEYLDSKNDNELRTIFLKLPATKDAAIAYLKGLSKKLFEIVATHLNDNETSILERTILKNTDEFLDVVVHADEKNNYFAYLEKAEGNPYRINLTTEDIINIIQNASYADGKMIRLLSCSNLESAKAISSLMPNRIFVATEDIVLLHTDGGVTTIAKSGNATQKWRKLQNGEDIGHIEDDKIRKPAGVAINNYIVLGDDESYLRYLQSKKLSELTDDELDELWQLRNELFDEYTSWRKKLGTNDMLTLNNKTAFDNLKNTYENDPNVEVFYRAMSGKEYGLDKGFLSPRFDANFNFITEDSRYLLDNEGLAWKRIKGTRNPILLELDANGKRQVQHPEYQYIVMYVVDKDVKKMLRRDKNKLVEGGGTKKCLKEGKVCTKEERTYQNWGFVGKIAEKQFNPHVQKVIVIETKFLIP
ncbi:hypothetical protein AD998_21400 [bacterium 336/3]|nr:hypothetical protein AD998_21400 [bacterium 336/3]